MCTISFDFDQIPDRHDTGSVKWDKHKGRDVIPLWIADMDFRSPPAVIRALHERVEHGVFGYTAPSDELVEAIRANLQAEYGWSVQPEWIVWLPGLVPGLNIACRAFGVEGDDVLAAVPIYPPFLAAIRNSGRNAVTVPLVLRDGRWTFDFDRLESAITPRTRVLLHCSPHNPVGRVYTREELATLAEICIRHDIVICSDEVHCQLVLDTDKRHIPTATLSPEVAARTITLLAPSKTYNLPGLAASYAVIRDDAIRRRVNRTMAGIVPFINLFGLTAMLAGYRDSHDWHAALLDYLRTNRDIVERAIGGMPGLSMTHVEATYLAWIDARGLGVQDPARFFEEAGVGLGDGKEFAGAGFLRLTFGCPRPLLVEALERMARVLRGR